MRTLRILPHITPRTVAQRNREQLFATKCISPHAGTRAVSTRAVKGRRRDHAERDEDDAEHGA
jgi:hypothetical protein